MKAVSVVFLLAVISFCEGSAIFPSPHNLTVQSLNTQYILKWQWEPQTPPNQSVTFTAQYLHKFKIKRKKQDWKSVCNATLDTQCDFSLAQLHYQGTYVFRVRADCAGESSEWAQTEFCPYQDANLGPPSKLQVFHGNKFLWMLISDPLNSNNKSMREILLPSLYFYIQYWKHSENLVEGSQFLKTSNNDVTLVDLQSWTTYCVRVRCHFDFYNKTSHFSPVVCVKIEGQKPMWLVILASCPVLAALTFGLYRCIPLFKSTFFPSTQLPASMYLCTAEPGLDWSHLLAVEAQVDVFCEKLEVHPKVVPPEMPPLPHSPGHSHEGSCKVETWMIALILVVSFVVVSVTLPLLFLVTWYFYKGLKFFYPTDNLPENLKKYIMEPPHQYILKAMQNSSLQEEQYQEVSIISESPLVEEGPLCSNTEEQKGADQGVI